MPTFGYVFDSYDPRDMDEISQIINNVLPQLKTISELPEIVDYSVEESMPPVWNQQDIGSCVAHGCLAAYLYVDHKAGGDDPMLSRLQLYYEAREMMGTVQEDSGAQIRDSIKIMARQGTAPEVLWPYDTEKYQETPPDAAEKAAGEYQLLYYFRVLPSITRILNRLANGFLIIDGMPVFESMLTEQVADTGQVPMPERGEKLVGWHCTLTVGYDRTRQVLIKRNSWGEEWGQHGYFEIPFSYSKLLMDRWALRFVE